MSRLAWLIHKCGVCHLVSGAQRWEGSTERLYASLEGQVGVGRG